VHVLMFDTAVELDRVSGLDSLRIETASVASPSAGALELHLCFRASQLRLAGQIHGIAASALTLPVLDVGACIELFASCRNGASGSLELYDLQVADVELQGPLKVRLPVVEIELDLAEFGGEVVRGVLDPALRRGRMAVDKDARRPEGPRAKTLEDLAVQWITANAGGSEGTRWQCT